MCACAHSEAGPRIKLCSGQLDQLSAFFKVKTSDFCLTGQNEHTHTSILGIFLCVSFFHHNTHGQPTSLCHLNPSLCLSLTHIHTHTHLSSVFHLNAFLYPVNHYCLTPNTSPDPTLMSPPVPHDNGWMGCLPSPRPVCVFVCVCAYTFNPSVFFCLCESLWVNLSPAIKQQTFQ